MSTSTQIPSGPGLVQISSLEDMIRDRVAEERARLEKEAGVVRKQVHHFQKPVERAFTADQRPSTTLLFGGLTWKHEKLIHGALEGLGYRCEVVPVPDVKAFQLGKEYGNNGQCNPTYFTVGNLVQYLQKLEESGVRREDLLNNYIFLTAGACGPCRFGMYEAEYRLALRNAGFDGFRVMLFQQSGGLNQAEAEAGLAMNLDFFLNLLNAMNMGDVINEVAHQIRPFEANAGETDAVHLERVAIEEMDGAKKYYDFKERCVYCDIIRQEEASAARLVIETERFMALEPYAPRFPFETWVMPMRHLPETCRSGLSRASRPAHGPRSRIHSRGRRP